VDSITFEEKLKRLRQLLKEMESLVLAYSGGVDSTFLLKVAADTLKDKVLAVTAKSPTYPEREYINALKIAQGFEVKFLSIFTDEFLQLEFVRNSPDRCFYCKQELYTKLKEIARRENLKWVADGSNFDDEEIVRIEVEPADMEKVIYHREKIGAKLKDLGYTYIVLDLEGYRPGSLNLVPDSTVLGCHEDN